MVGEAAHRAEVNQEVGEAEAGGASEGVVVGARETHVVDDDVAPEGLQVDEGDGQDHDQEDARGRHRGPGHSSPRGG